ncbi:hypothetical protein [Sanguibacter sp. 25GB23B1]|uniref:hypothetical protein n=1 Tax=Sanguibacter sp. 25GB23B1 TaxID=3156067 RepID=UPI0032AF012A
MTDSQPTAPLPVQPEATAATEPIPPARRPLRPSTIIWGLVVAVVGAGILARALGAEFDNDLALIVLLGAAGVALVGTSIASAVRRR